MVGFKHILGMVSFAGSAWFGGRVEGYLCFLVTLWVAMHRLWLLGLVFKLCTSPCMMAEDCGLGVMLSATALLSVSLVGRMVSVLCLR